MNDIEKTKAEGLVGIMVGTIEWTGKMARLFLPPSYKPEFNKGMKEHVVALRKSLKIYKCF